MVRTLADHNVSRYAEIAAWPLREALLTYVEMLRREARETYLRECDRYMHGRQIKDEPRVPAILASDR